MSNSTIPTKLRDFMKRAGMTMDELAQAMGYARASSIQRYLTDGEYKKNFISPDFAEKLAKALSGKGGVNAVKEAEVWALTGAKPSLVSSYDPDEVESEDDGTVSYSREHWVPAVDGAIPEVDTKLGAGMGTVGQTINLPVGGNSVSGHMVIAEWLIPLSYLRNEAKASPAHTLIMEVVGDSMQPTYMPGDRVLVDLSQDKMSTDTVYAISDGHTEPQIKRLQRIPFSDPAEVRIISDNPALETFTVELSRLQIIGRIVGHLARK